MKEIDARNRQCPGPVLMTRQVVGEQSPEQVAVIVDNDAARQNVSRFLTSAGYDAKDEKLGDDFRVTGTKLQEKSGFPEKAKTGEPVVDSAVKTSKIMVMLATDRIGYGDDELGLKLMANFVRTLNEFGDDLWRLVFVNNGVKLAIEDSDVVSELLELESGGVKIMVCGTCLEHYGLTGKNRAGETTNMLDIITAMHLADKVITM